MMVRCILFLVCYLLIQCGYGSTEAQKVRQHTHSVVHAKKHKSHNHKTNHHSAHKLKQHKRVHSHKITVTHSLGPASPHQIKDITSIGAENYLNNINANEILTNDFTSEDKTNVQMSSIQERLVKFVHETVSALQYTAYKLGGKHFDASNGIYVIDCSSYVDHLLNETTPDAYEALVNSSGANSPNSRNYYNFFTSLVDEPKEYWDKVEEVNRLQPGDIIVFRYASGHSSRGNNQAGGHVMVVMSKPVRDANAFLVRVADSARTGHSHDTRARHESGIGIGTLLLKVNPKTGQPDAYAWKAGSRWNKNVRFAMGRPIEA